MALLTSASFEILENGTIAHRIKPIPQGYVVVGFPFDASLHAKPPCGLHGAIDMQLLKPA